MNTQKILLLGPEGVERAELEQRLTRLGGDVMPVVPTANFVPEFGDVIVLDAREESVDWAILTGDLTDDSRPLVIVADAPRHIMRALSGRRGGVLVLTGAENDGGYRVAMNLCAALAGRERPDRPTEGHRERVTTSDRVTTSEWAPSAANPAVAI
jgi:hypothetical protein